MIYAGDNYESPYPTPAEQIHKKCDICGLDMVVNNWADGKSRTPMYKGFVVCVTCDPRHIDDIYMKEGYRILHPRRLRIIKMAQVTRALSGVPCIRRPIGDVGCGKCAECVALKLFPPI